MNNVEEVLAVLPNKLCDRLKDRILYEEIYEIRIKINKPILIYSKFGESNTSYIVTKEEMKNLVQKIVGFSLYAYEEDIRQGFITIRGGHRIGLAGECVMENGYVKTIRNISSVNIRISRQIIGASDKIMKFITSNNRVYNTIIISPPKCGKTTILRDIARNISDGINNLRIVKEKFDGKKVVVIDERSEIAACFMGIPQNDLGVRTDVLDNCLKREGLLMAIRSLSPDVLICDEIGTTGDVEALTAAFNSGVNIITTIHGFTIEDLYKRRVLSGLLNNNVIERVIVLSNREGVGTIENIYSLNGGEKECLN